MASKDAVLWRVLCLFFLLCGTGAKHVTPNFVVEAPTAAIAEQVAKTAERCREELAVEWLGHKLKNWYRPCQVRVKVGQVGAGGATTFSFSGGEVYGWDMTVQGPLERILDSVIPHEVSHTILACHFRRPLPRWADEGAATLAEESSERRRQQKLAEEVLPTKRRIPLRELLKITEYPKNMDHVLTLYAQGFSLADFLVQQGGKARFLTFIQEAHGSGWDAAFRKHYSEANVEAVERKWSQWVIAGSPSLRQPEGVLLASAKTASSETTERTGQEPSVVRSQTPDEKATHKASTREHNPLDAGDNRRSAADSVAATTKPTTKPQSRSTPARLESDDDSRKPDKLMAAANHTDSPSRLPRGVHLTRPELRRGHASPAAAESLEIPEPVESVLRPSPFEPIETVEATSSEAPFAGNLQSASLRSEESASSRSRSAGRSSEVTAPVRPVFERESSLRFKPFRSR